MSGRRPAFEKSSAATYATVNVVFAALLTLAFVYSWWFYPAAHPVKCRVLAATGNPCRGCGLSRAFSAFVHLRFHEGMAWNPAALPAFGYLGAQFFVRWSLAARAFVGKPPAASGFFYADATLSLAGFLVTFLPFVSPG